MILGKIQPRNMSKKQREALLIESINPSDKLIYYIARYPTTRTREFVDSMNGMISGKIEFSIARIKSILKECEHERIFRS